MNKLNKNFVKIKYKAIHIIVLYLRGLFGISRFYNLSS